MVLSYTRYRENIKWFDAVGSACRIGAYWFHAAHTRAGLNRNNP